MGNNWDSLMRLVVPGIFLLIWAVNQLFNKELNPGANRLPAPGPRPGGGLPPAPRPMDRVVQQDPRQPTMRFGTTTTTERRGNDEVLVIRAEPNRVPARPAPAQPARRNVRTKQPPPPPPRRAETFASRTQTTGVSQSVSQAIELPVDLKQMSVAQSLATSASALAATTQDLGMAETAATESIRRLMTNPARVREAWIVNELLQPPLALRGRHRP